MSENTFEAVLADRIGLRFMKYRIRANVLYILVNRLNYDAFFDLCDEVKDAIECLGFDEFVIEMNGYPGSRRRYRVGLADRLS